MTSSPARRAGRPRAPAAVASRAGAPARNAPADGRGRRGCEPLPTLRASRPLRHERSVTAAPRPWWITKPPRSPPPITKPPRSPPPRRGALFRTQVNPAPRSFSAQVVHAGGWVARADRRTGHERVDSTCPLFEGRTGGSWANHFIHLGVEPSRCRPSRPCRAWKRHHRTRAEPAVPTARAVVRRHARPVGGVRRARHRRHRRRDARRAAAVHLPRLHDQHMFHPVLVFDGEYGQSISALLRPGNAHAARGAATMLERIIRALKQRSAHHDRGAWRSGVRVATPDGPPRAALRRARRRSPRARPRAESASARAPAPLLAETRPAATIS